MSAQRHRELAVRGVVVTILGVTMAATLVAGDPPRANYERPFEPATRPAYIPLPPGAVEPTHWLKDWCLAARDGYTGHMDDFDDEFKRAWAADHCMTGDRLMWYNGAWPYEGGGYWFEGLTRLGFALHDDMLMQQAKRRLDVVVDHMHPDSLLFLWWLNRNSEEDRKAVQAALEGWTLWASGQLGRALASYYYATGDERILKALQQAYGTDPDCLRSITGSMSNVWPAFDTYTWTGNKVVGDALTAMFDKDHPGLKPILNRYRTAPSLAPGTVVENQHVVEFVENVTPWAVGYLWTGDASYLQATLGWHELIDRVAMQPHGVPVSDEWYVPTGAFRGSETCDVANYLWSQLALVAVSGEAKLADRAERAFFNAGAAAVSRDFKTHVYFQSPNRFAAGSPDFPHGPRGGGGVYQPKHSPLCCTAALNRILPYYVSQMWMATYDNGLAAICYGPCTVKALVAERVPVEITCDTQYPFEETCTFSVQPARDAEFPLLFRIPGWCQTPEVTLNGVSLPAVAGTTGFLSIRRTWHRGDQVCLRFPMEAVITKGHDNAPTGPFTGEHKPTLVTVPDPARPLGAPYACVSYGPLLFSLPIPDAGDENTVAPNARWNFALGQRSAAIRVEREAMPAHWDWPLASPLKLKLSASSVAWNPSAEMPQLPAKPIAEQGDWEEITLIPYGCTRFRISMFPVTAE